MNIIKDNSKLMLLGLGAMGVVAAGGALWSFWNGRNVSNASSEGSTPVLPASPPKLENEVDLKCRRTVTLRREDSETLSKIDQKVGSVLSGEGISSEQLTLPSDTLLRDSDYGTVRVQPFAPTWLRDYPQLIEHLESEHLLHVKGLDERGEGLNWHKEKFSTDMDSRFNPEVVVKGSKRGGFQMKMGYFIVPVDKMKEKATLSLSGQVQEDMVVKDTDGNTIGYRFFVHPKAYDHFRVLHGDAEISYIPPEKSDFIATPTSSYRSLAIRRVEENAKGELVPGNKSVPFIVKLGVSGDILGADRWLSVNEVKRSVKNQRAFDGMSESVFHREKEGSDLVIFPESMGIVLRGVDNYPPLESGSDKKAKESGILVREFPKELLKGECRILSMAALMSTERVKEENAGLGTDLGSHASGFERTPLIFEVIDAAIQAGKVASAEEFIQKYLIEGYIDAIEPLLFQENMPLEPHSQNLCIVLNNDLTPRGFAYRDHGGVWVDIATRGLQGKDTTPFSRKKDKEDQKYLFKTQGAIAGSYLTNYSWFYRYQVFIKLLNVMTKVEESKGEYFPPPPGAPSQIGCDEKLPERNLSKYVVRKLEDSPIQATALGTINKLSLTYEQHKKAIQLLDHYYLAKMDRYFDVEKVGIKLDEGCLPAAEGGSPDQEANFQHQGFLGKYRFYKIPSDGLRVSMETVPGPLRDKIVKNAITSFESKPVESLKPKEIMILDKGVCFFNEKNEIIAFTPFASESDRTWMVKQLRLSLSQSL